MSVITAISITATIATDSLRPGALMPRCSVHRQRTAPHRHSPPSSAATCVSHSASSSPEYIRSAAVSAGCIAGSAREQPAQSTSARLMPRRLCPAQHSSAAQARCSARNELSVREAMMPQAMRSASGRQAACPRALRTKRAPASGKSIARYAPKKSALPIVERNIAFCFSLMLW